LGRGGRAAVVVAALAAAACLDSPPGGQEDGGAGGVCPAPDGPLDPALGDVLTFTFEEDDQATEVVHDLSGNRLDGVLAGGDLATGCEHGTCLASTGTSPMAAVPMHPLLHLGTGFTIEVAVRRDATGSFDNLLGIHDPTTGLSELNFSIRDDNGLYFGIASGGSCEPGADTSIEVPPEDLTVEADTWVHLAVTWDGEVVRFYKEGQPVYSADFAVTPCAMDRPLLLGGFGDGNDLDGRMDDVKISGRVKTDEEIQVSLVASQDSAPRCGNLLVEAGEDCESPASCCDAATCRYADGCACDGECVAGLCVGEQGRTGVGLVALYDFDEGEGTTVVDTSGSGLDLAIDGPSYSWRPGSLVLSGGTALRSSSAATAVVEACQDTQEVTVEVWIAPAFLSGTAQTIAMMGLGDDCQAFGLRQDVDQLAAAVSTDETDADGGPNVDTPDGALGTELTHVVLTRSVDGWRRLYLDGRLVSENLVVGDFSMWDPAQRLTVGGPVLGVSDTCESGQADFWQGEVHRVAVYSRALSAAEVAGNYGAGPDIESSALR